MAINFNSLGFAQPTDGDQTWGDDIRLNYDKISEMIAPQNCYFVAPNFSDANLGTDATDRRHFDSIQDAIDAYESAVGNNQYGIIYVYPGVYTEAITATTQIAIVGVTDSAFSSGAGRKVVLQQSGLTPTIKFEPVSSVDCTLFMANFDVRNTRDSSTTVAAWVETTDQGAGNYGTFGNRVAFKNCTFRGEDTYTAFTRGFEINAWTTLGLLDCDVKMPQTTSRVIELNGAATKSTRLKAHRTNINHWASSGTYTISGDTNTIIEAYDCTSTRDRSSSYVVDSGGTHVVLGLSSDNEASKYKNSFGLEIQTF